MSLLAAGGASAQSMWSIDQREANQQQRIDAGRHDGSLTRNEAYRLERGEQRIDRYEARARADGVVTPGERQRLDGMLDRESRSINHERNDGQRAGGHDNGNHYGWDRGNQYGDRGNHNGWNQADAGRNGWNHDPRGNDGRNDGDRNHGSWNQGSWNHSGQPPAPGTTPPTHTGWNGHGQGTDPSNGQHSWTHQPGANGTPTAPPATTPATGQNNGQNNRQNTGWTHGTTNTASVQPAPSYTRSTQARVMPISAPATSAVAPSRAPSSGGRTSRH